MEITLIFLLELVSYCDIKFGKILSYDSDFDQPFIKVGCIKKAIYICYIHDYINKFDYYYIYDQFFVVVINDI